VPSTVFNQIIDHTSSRNEGVCSEEKDKTAEKSAETCENNR